MALFFLRQNFGDNCGDAQAPADGFGSAPVVACGHDDVHTQLPEGGNGGGTAGFGGIRNGDQTQQTAIRSKKQRRLSLCGQSFCLGENGCDIHAGCFQHGPVAAQSLLPADGGFYAAAVDCSKTTDGNGRKCTPGCFLGDSRGQGMLRRPLQAGCNGQKIFLGNAGRREKIGNAGLTFGDGAGFVQHHSVDMVQGFQRGGGFNKDTIFCTLSGANHDGHRCGQPQRTGAGDHQYRNGGGQSKAKGCPAEQPDQKRDQGDCHDGRDENAGDFIGQAGNRGFGSGSIFHQMNDLGQGRVLSHPGGFKHKGAGFIDGSRNYGVAGTFFNGDAFAGQGGLIHGRCPLHHGTVCADALTGADADTVAHADFLNRYCEFLSVSKDGSGFGRQIHQFFDSGGRFAAGAGFQEFAHGDQCEDHTGGLKVEAHMILLHQRGVVMAEAVGQLVENENTVSHGSGGTDGYQGIHVGRTVPQRFEADPVVFAVEGKDGEGEQQLGQGKGQQIVMPRQERRQGQAQHVPHGDVEQGEEERDGPEEAVLHLVQFSLIPDLRRFAHRGGS